MHEGDLHVFHTPIIRTSERTEAHIYIFQAQALMTQRSSLFADSPVLASGFLDVSGGKKNRSTSISSGDCDEIKVWYQVTGNLNGVPVLLFHGGPGYYTVPEDHRLFDPAVYMVISFDQRGCGKSQPPAHTVPFSFYKNITLEDIVADAELVRKKACGTRPCCVAGWSWGSACALAYAETYPSCVAGMLLQGVYTGTIEEHAPLFSPTLRTGAYDDAVRCLVLAIAIALKPRCPDIDVPARLESDALALMRRPLELHETLRDFILTCNSDDLEQTTDAHRVLAIWSQYENFLTYPDSREYFMEKLVRASDLSVREYRASNKDVTGALMQLFLFPQMMRRQVSLVDPLELLRLAQVASKFEMPFVWIVQGDDDEVCPCEAAKALSLNLRHCFSMAAGAAVNPKPKCSTKKAKAVTGKSPVPYVKLILVSGASHETADNGGIQRAVLQCTAEMSSAAFERWLAA